MLIVHSSYDSSALSNIIMLEMDQTFFHLTQHARRHNRLLQFILKCIHFSYTIHFILSGYALDSALLLYSKFKLSSDWNNFPLNMIHIIISDVSVGTNFLLSYKSYSFEAFNEAVIV